MKTKAIITIILSAIFLLGTAFTTPEQHNGEKYTTDMGVVSVLYAMWDQNHNRKIESTEWNHAINNYLKTSETGAFSFSAFDKDGNEVLDINEFRQAVAGLNNDHLAMIFDNDPANVAAATKYEVWHSGEKKMVKVNAGDHTIEHKGLASGL